MSKPRIFLCSSGKQEKLLAAPTRGLEDVAHVEPWTTQIFLRKEEQLTEEESIHPELGGR